MEPLSTTVSTTQVPGTIVAESMHNQVTDDRMDRELFRGFPVELLEEIFWLACSTHEVTDKYESDFMLWTGDVSRPVSRQYYRNLAKLSTVCKSWYNISQNTPSLWRVITSFDTSDVIDRALRRSGQSPLIVKGKFRWNRPQCSEGIFLPKVFDHVERWEEIDVVLSNRPDIHFFQPPAPRLRHFRIDVVSFPSLWSPPPPPQSIHLFQGDAPMLKTLDITQLSVEWKTFKFDSLHSLCLNAVAISIAELLSILSNISSLRELKLKALCFTDLNTTGHATRVVLTHLTRFDIDGLSTVATMTVLNSIVMPLCEAFSFIQKGPQGLLGHWNDTPIAAWLVKNLSQSLPVLFKSPVTVLATNHYTGGLNVYGGDYSSLAPAAWTESRLRVNFEFLETPPPMEVLVWLADNFGQPPITLNLPPDFYLEMDRTILRKLPSVAQLVLHEEGRDLAPLLEDLGTPFAVGSGRQRLFPNLKDISFHGKSSCTREDVLRMLEQRYAHVDGVPPPAGLDTLVIDSIPPGPENATTIGRLGELLGKGAVFSEETDWDSPAS